MSVNVLMVKAYIDTVPMELDESALIEGATHWQTFWYLVFPLVRTILAVVAVLVFVGTFNEFVMANVLLQDVENFTLMKGLYQMVVGQFVTKWGIFAAGALLGALPIVAVYLLLQDQIVGGLTQGAVKG
jgi:ABC-type maltose transport system permease subunit